MRPAAPPCRARLVLVRFTDLLSVSGGGDWVWGGRRDSLLPIVSLLPDALIVMNATDDWTVFDGRTGSIGC